MLDLIRKRDFGNETEGAQGKPGGHEAWAEGFSPRGAPVVHLDNRVRSYDDLRRSAAQAFVQRYGKGIVRDGLDGACPPVPDIG